jgi:phage terminase large subunit-like protein
MTADFATVARWMMCVGIVERVVHRDEKKAQYAVDFINILKLTDDFYGQPFLLMDWQEKIVRDVYGTMNTKGVRLYRRVYLEVPKKNAKSQFASGLANLHLFNRNEPNQAIYGCAGTKEQARIIFDSAVQQIEQNKTLLKKSKILDAKKRIENKETGSFYELVSSESFSKHGYKVSMCIFDEWHVQPTRTLWDVMTKGAGLSRKEPMWVVLTTAGDDPDRVSIAWEIHEKAEAIIKARESGDLSKDLSTWYPVIYGYQGDKIWDENNWKLANPSLGTTFQLDDLREIAAEAKLSPADERSFRWLNLNQWPTTKLSSWLPLDLFDKTEAKGWTREDLVGEECYVGGDYSTTTDLSAMVLIFPPQGDHEDWRVIFDPFIPKDTMLERIKVEKLPYDVWEAEGYVTATDGNEIDYTVIEERLLLYHELYQVNKRAADRTFATMLMQRMDAMGNEFVDIPQTPHMLTDPMNQIEVFLRKGIMTHEKHPVARVHFGNTSIWTNGSGQKKYVKETKGKGVTKTKRIDITAAWVIGMKEAMLHEGGGSVYDKRGIVTL